MEGHSTSKIFLYDLLHTHTHTHTHRGFFKNIFPMGGVQEREGSLPQTSFLRSMWGEQKWQGLC